MMSIYNNDEPFEAQFSIYYDDNKLYTTMKNNKNQSLVSLKEPKLMGFFGNFTKDCSPIYQIGTKDNEPVYRVSEELAFKHLGNNVGDLVVFEDLLFPDVLLLTFNTKQMDVMIRKKSFADEILPIEIDNDDDNDVSTCTN